MTESTREFEKQPDGTHTYKVISGDSLWKIARGFIAQKLGADSVSNNSIATLVDAIARANALDEEPRNRDLIYPNEKIIIPAQ